MSGEGSPALDLSDVADLRLAVVATMWHPRIVAELLESALRMAADAGAAPPTVVRVPGALEVPVVAQQLATDHDAIVALGLVLRGDTAHFEFVCRVVTDGCARVALDTGTPVAQGVLMCDTMEQAQDRSGRSGSREDKGREAVGAALATAVTLRQLRGSGRRRTGF